jgi:NitT/TauT family transport system permease protein
VTGSAATFTAPIGSSAAPADRVGRSARRWAASAGRFVLFIVLFCVVWEGLKLLGGDPIRTQWGIYVPPFHWQFASDLNMPHITTMISAFFQPVQRGSSQTLLEYLIGAALFTWTEAALGFVAGAILGYVLATVFVHSSLAERAFVPYVIASQTIPIVALAPMITFAFGQSIGAVVLVATYLTFFPVTIALIRGFRAPDPRALELMRSYAATRATIHRRLRTPASLPYLFTALKIAATASIVGAIVGEGPGGVPNGLGRAIINFNQYYITGPAKLWDAIIVSAWLGVIFFSIVRIAEHVVLRGRPSTDQG